MPRVEAVLRTVEVHVLIPVHPAMGAWTDPVLAQFVE